MPNTLVSEVFCGLAHHVGKRWPSVIARAVLSVRRSRAIAKHTGFRGFLWVGSLCWAEVTLFHCKSCAFIRSKPRYCQTHWFQRFFWVGSSCWEEVTLFHCKSCAFIRSKPRYCQTHWFQRFFCGLAHHVGKRWPSFIERAVLSVGRSRTIAKHTGFRGFLWVGSSCWEEVTLFHCKSCAFIRSKPRYCQTHWFQRFFGLAHHVGKR